MEKSVSMSDFAVLRRWTLIDGFHRLDIDEFMRGFILTTRGDLQSKIDYTFRIYDQNDDNQISGDEIQKMAEVRLDDSETDDPFVPLSLPPCRTSCECWVVRDEVVMKQLFSLFKNFSSNSLEMEKALFISMISSKQCFKTEKCWPYFHHSTVRWAAHR